MSAAYDSELGRSAGDSSSNPAGNGNSHPGRPTTSAASEPYVISDERLDEIRGLINWKHAGWQTVPSSPQVTVYDLAAAVEDLLMERDDRG